MHGDEGAVVGRGRKAIAHRLLALGTAKGDGHGLGEREPSEHLLAHELHALLGHNHHDLGD